MRKRLKVYDDNGDIVKIECVDCKNVLPVEAFICTPSGVPYSYCNACRTRRYKKYRKAFRERWYNGARNIKYSEEYIEEEQKGVPEGCLCHPRAPLARI